MVKNIKKINNKNNISCNYWFDNEKVKDKIIIDNNRSAWHAGYACLPFDKLSFVGKEAKELINTYNKVYNGSNSYGNIHNYGFADRIYSLEYRIDVFNLFERADELKKKLSNDNFYLEVREFSFYVDEYGIIHISDFKCRHRSPVVSSKNSKNLVPLYGHFNGAWNPNETGRSTLFYEIDDVWYIV